MKKHIVLASLLFLLTHLPTFAQQPDLTGKWNLYKLENLSGTSYGNALPKTITLQKQDDQLKIETVTQGSDADVTANETVSLKGDAVTGKTSKNAKRVSVVKWSPDKSLNKTSTYSQPGDDSKIAYTRIDEFSLSADGKTLIITRTFTSATDTNDHWSARGMYTK